MMYADDVLLLSTTPEGMQQLLNVTKQFSTKYLLRVNPGKSALMIFGGDKDEPQLLWDGTPIPVYHNFPQLGIHVTVDGNPLPAINHRCKLAWAAIDRIDSAMKDAYCTHILLTVKMWKTVISPTLLFGVQVWGPLCKQKHWTMLQTIQSTYFRNALQLPKSVDMDIVRAELGLFLVKIEALILVIGCVQKVLKMEETRMPYMALEYVQQDTTPTGWMQALHMLIQEAGLVQYKLDKISEGSIRAAHLRKVWGQQDITSFKNFI